MSLSSLSARLVRTLTVACLINLALIDCAEADSPEWRTFPSAKKAFAELLRQKPRVLGIGEFHQTNASARVPSSISRFTQELLPLLRNDASDLVIETWVTTGQCGEEEKKAVADIDQTTKRPAETENEILALIRAAQRQRIRPHILEMNCADYQRFLTAEGVDYEHFLAFTGDQLKTKVSELAAIRGDPVKRAVDDALNSLWQSQKGEPPPDRALVVVYGGALHNDVQPTSEFAAASYATDVAAKVSGHYLELDLYVPEYIEDEESLLRTQSWFSLFEQHQSRQHVLLIRRSEHSYVLIFRRTLAHRPEK